MKMTPTKAWAELVVALTKMKSLSAELDAMGDDGGYDRMYDALDEFYDATSNAVEAFTVLAFESEAANDIADMLAFTFGEAGS